MLRLRDAEYLEKLLNILQIADEDLAMSILNIFIDLVERKRPNYLIINSASVSKNLITVA